MLANDLRGKVKDLMVQAKADLAEMVAAKSVADPKQYPPEECIKAANIVIDRFTKLGFEDVSLHDTPDGHPCVVGHKPGPPGTPTVLLYAHYDVQPPLGEDAWESPPFKLVERDGRWYGRGSADCKGNIVMHLTALRALEGNVPCNVKLVVEGSEEQGTGGLEEFVVMNPDLLRADTILLVDTGNFAVGIPTLTTTLRGLANVDVKVSALSSVMHSGMFGGPAPDPVAALIHLLSTLRDEHGNTTIDGLDNEQTWSGVDYPAEQFRKDANVLDGVDLIGSGSVAEMLWARPTVTVLGIDVPPVIGSASAIQSSTRARLNLRVPPGMDGQEAQDALVAHLEKHAPWNVKVEIERVAVGDPFVSSLSGPGFEAMKTAMKEAYGRELTTEGQGGSIPLCNVLSDTYPDAEIMLMGVEEPQSLIHAPNESVDPSEIENMALAEALFLETYAART